MEQATHGKACIERRSRHGVETVLMRRGELTEASITIHVNGNAHLAHLLDEACKEVESLGLTVLRQDVFGTSAQHDKAPALLGRVRGAVEWPVTWLEEGDSLGERLTGTHLYAVSGVEVRRLTHNGDIVGSVYNDGRTEHCLLGGIVSTDARADRAGQTRGVLERIEAVLGSAGMTFGNVVRTWFYNDRILDWYGEFNKVRTAFFEERGIFDGLVPASTGIGGGNLHGAALVADVLAMRPLDPDAAGTTIGEIESPLQCPATDYRSSFSRAVEVAAPDHRRLYVSGTASIDAEGRTVWVGDVAGQIELTLDVVGAILDSRGMAWNAVSRAIAYVKRGADAGLYHETLRRRGLPPLPAVVTENDVCRDDLLFELEVDAWQVSST